MAKKKEPIEIIEEGETKNPKDNKFLTLFIIFSISLLIAMTSAIDGQIVRLGFQIVLLLLQVVLLKNLLDRYYGEY